MPICQTTYTKKVFDGTNVFNIAKSSVEYILRTIAGKFSSTDFFLKISPLKDDELVMSEIQKNWASPTSFWREHARKNT